jgi:NADPH-dependent ferric siderophore reductase
MLKRIRRRGHLIQNPQKRIKEIALDDLSSRHAPAGKFRITALRHNQDSTTAWIVGEYTTFKEAKESVDNFSEVDVDYYVHSNSSRILYSKKGSP